MASSGGGSSTDREEEIRQQVSEIASRYRLFQCVECATAIKEFLIAKGIPGKHIKVDLEFQDLPWSVIYDLRREQQIATNGHHEGIAIAITDRKWCLITLTTMVLRVRSGGKISPLPL